MKQIIYIIIASLFILFSASGILMAQSGNSENSIGLAIGIYDVHLRDQYLSPYIFGGTIFSSQVSYNYKISQSRHEVNISFSTGNISSANWSLESKQYIGQFSYSYLHSLHSWNIENKQFELFLGTGLSSFAQFSVISTPPDINWFGPTDKSLYWSHSIDLHLLGEYRFTERRIISLRISSPFLRFVSRPDYSHNFNYRNYSVSNSFFSGNC